MMTEDGEPLTNLTEYGGAVDLRDLFENSASPDLEDTQICS